MPAHAGQEPAEFFAADLATALVDVMNHIIVQQAEHAIQVMGIEGGEVTLDQLGGLALRA